MNKKQTVRLNEKQLMRIIQEAVANTVNQQLNQDPQQMADAFNNEFQQECVRFLPAAWENCNGDKNRMWQMIEFHAKRAFRNAYGDF